MEASKEKICTRISVINKTLLENNAVNSQKWSKETLLDAFVILFEECSANYLKDNNEIASFIESYRFTISELKKLRVNSSDFEVLHLIGNGNFATVHMVKERQTGHIYAMKTIRKSRTVKNKQTCFNEEREIMATTTSVWHTVLRYAFHDSTKLYMVMDYHPGGDLRGLLERHANVFGEKEAIFYLREIILAISALHDLGYIHRDIKPDNVLLDRSGHVKLADFGSAARIGPDGAVMNKDNIAAGTPAYIAPEVLHSYAEPSQVYGRACDYWSLGIIAYEMMLGVPPFTGTRTVQTYNNILQHENTLSFPDDVIIDKEYLTFVKQLLTDELIRPNYEKIISSPLFRGTDWEKVRELPPPFVPSLKDEEDTSMFTSIDLQSQPPNIENFKSKTMFSGRNLPFIGYTYTPEAEREGPSPNTGAVRKDSSQLEMKQRQVESLRNRVSYLEIVRGEHISLEQKYEESQRLLESIEAVRSNTEQELATAMTETSALRRTLEVERNERKDLEDRALDLIKSAKLRWKAEQDTRNLELQTLIDSQGQQITELVTWNNELTQKMQRVNEMYASCTAELRSLRNIQEQYENKLKNTRDQSRQSFSGLQAQLKLVSDDAESRVHSLKQELEEAWKSNEKLRQQCEEIRSQNKILETKLKSNEEDFKVKLTERDTHIQELTKEQAMLQSDLIAYAEREHEMQSQITDLQDEKAKLTVEFEKTNQIKQKRERECEDLRILYNTHTDKFNADLEHAIEQQKAKEEIRVKSLQDTIKQLENEISNLRPQVMEYATNKTKVAELEALVARLEAGKNKDAAVTAREDLLKEQIEKLQKQIKELHETAALADQELGKTKTELWTKEKALKDTSIDARILARELQDAKNEIKSITAQVKICEDRAKYAEDLVNVDHERAKAAEAKHLSLMNENAGLKSRIARLEAQVLKLQTVEAEAAELKVSKQELEQKIKLLDAYVVELSKTAETAKHMEISFKHELSELKAELDSLLTAYGALQESSTILEQQVDGYDRLVISLKNKEESLELKIIDLVKDCDTLQSALDKTKQSLVTSRNEKAAVDTRLVALETQIFGLETEMQVVQEDLRISERRYDELYLMLNQTEDEKNQAVLKTITQQNTIETMQKEIVQLKEETSQRLTRLIQAREINMELHEDILAKNDDIDRLTNRLDDIEYTNDQIYQRYAEEISSLESRLKQFEKVSDNLLDRLTLEERKKTALSKLFLKKNPEPARPYTYRELQQQHQKLQADYEEMKNKYQLLQSSIETPLTARVQAAMASAALEDARDVRAAAAARLAKATVDARRALADESKELCEASVAETAAVSKEIRAIETASLAEAVVESDFRRKGIRMRSEASSEQPAAQTESGAVSAQSAAEHRRPSTAQLARQRERQSASQPTPSAPAYDDYEYNTNRQESHCFIHYSCKVRRMCRWCWNLIPLLRNCVQCTKCGILVHNTCKNYLPHACGMPEPIWENYIDCGLNHPECRASPSFYLPTTVSWVYVHSTNDLDTRQRRFIEIQGKSLNFYKNEIIDDSSIPVESFYLCTPDKKSDLCTDLSGRYHVDNIDLYVSVNFYESDTSGIPDSSIILEFTNAWDREAFIDAYNVNLDSR